MGKSGDRKRSKKSKRSKREKSSKKTRLSTNARRTEQAPNVAPPDAEPVLSADSQAIVIELQRTELSRLLREQQRLNDRVDQLLQLHEREQVLRQQMQASLDQLTTQRTLPPRHDNAVDQEGLVARVNRAEGKFAALQSAVGLLVATLERQMASAR
jgi:hypothetical protein